MSIIIKAYQTCPHGNRCKYNNSADGYCQGVDSNRNRDFVCEFITYDGNIVDEKHRSKYDETGKMKILLE